MKINKEELDGVVSVSINGIGGEFVKIDFIDDNIFSVTIDNSDKTRRVFLLTQSFRPVFYEFKNGQFDRIGKWDWPDCGTSSPPAEPPAKTDRE